MNNKHTTDMDTLIVSDMITLITLHNKGLIDDTAFTKAVKKLNEKNSPLHDVPFTQRDIDPDFGTLFDSVTGKKWVAKDKDIYKATFTPEQSDSKLMGLYIPDPYSGSILKKSDIFENTVNAIMRIPDVEVKVYSENRTQLPEHAKAMLEKFDEIWGKRVDEYNDSKDKWVRTITKDEDGNEVVEWVEKPPVLKDYPSEVIVEGDDADMNGLRHIFRLDIGEGEC